MPIAVVCLHGRIRADARHSDRRDVAWSWNGCLTHPGRGVGINAAVLDGVWAGGSWGALATYSQVLAESVRDELSEERLSAHVALCQLPHDVSDFGLDVWRLEVHVVPGQR